MSPRNYLKIISSHKTLIFVCAVLCGILALIFSALKPASYETSIAFSVQRVNRQDTSEFQYDNYYAIQASELLGNTIVGWLESPEIIREAYQAAGLAVSEDDLNALAQGMKAKQISAHLVRAKYSQTDRDQADKVAASLVTVINNKVEVTEKNADSKNSFIVTSPQPVIVEKKYGPATLALAGIFCGLFVGIGIAFGREYLKK
ncbi:MAG: hypothetical protein HQ530_05150 [Parcubacteria group bacterium]|nr:hypothetical protein [Parcubacteria group bacterium]